MATVTCPGCLERDQRIAALEGRVAELEAPSATSTPAWRERHQFRHSALRQSAKRTQARHQDAHRQEAGRAARTPPAPEATAAAGATP